MNNRIIAQTFFGYLFSTLSEVFEAAIMLTQHKDKKQRIEGYVNRALKRYGASINKITWSKKGSYYSPIRDYINIQNKILKAPEVIGAAVALHEEGHAEQQDTVYLRSIYLTYILLFF